MIFAQAWHNGTDGKLRPACGSDAVMHIDGRFGTARQHSEARKLLDRRSHYVAYTIHTGSYGNNRCLMHLPSTGNGVVPASDISPDFVDRMGRVRA